MKPISKTLEKTSITDLSKMVPPMWILEAVHAKDQPVIVEIDKSRREEIKEIKRKCFDYLPDRLLEGKRLR